MRRDLKLTVPVSALEREMAREVSKAEGLSLADWVRQRVRGAYASLTQSTPKQGGMCVCGHHHNLHTLEGHCDIYRMSNGKTSCSCRDFHAE